jgi:putative transcriptional regulator
MPDPVAVPTHHPADERLLEYASGALPEPLALLVATHLALCPRCRRVTGELEALGGVLLAGVAPEPLAEGSLEQALARLDQAPAVPAASPAAPARGGEPALPRPLRDYVGDSLDCLPWRRLGPVAEVRLLPDFAGFTTRLLWSQAGAAVPAHTHDGSELTLVLRGGFTDEHAHFLRGDVEEADGSVDHRPVADQSEDCICLAVTDAPLRLTSRFGRLLNPFLRI